MKYLILFLITFNAFANYLDKSKVGVCEDGQTVFMKSKPNTIKIPSGYNCAYHRIVAETQMKEETESCVDEADCQAELALKECEKGEAIYTLEPNEVYCTWIRPEQVMEDASLKATYEAEQAAKAQMTGAIAQAKAAMECGKNVKALLMVRNASKGLTTAQIKTMVNTYSEVDALLESGSLNTAKEEINAISPDGALVTEGDKTALVAEIDKCL